MAFLQSSRNKKKAELPSPEGKVLASMKHLSLAPNKEGTESRPSEGTEARQTEGKQVGQAAAGSYDQCIPNLSKGLRKFAIVTLPTKCGSGWISSVTGCVYIGARDGGSILITTKDGKMMGSVDLGPEYGNIVNGYELLDGHHLVDVYNEQTKHQELRSVRLDNDKLIRNNKIDTSFPKSIFPYDDMHVGVFCADPVRIELYGKSDMKLYMKILLDIELSQNTSRVDVCKSGEYFCISDSVGGVVHVVDETGDLVKTLGEKAEKLFLNIPGKLWHPYNVYQDVDNSLIIICSDGSYHRYAAGQWTMAVKTKGGEDQLWYAIVTNNRVYSVFKDRLSMYKIRI